MNDSQSPFWARAMAESRFRHRIHSGQRYRNVELDVSCQMRSNVDVVRGRTLLSAGSRSTSSNVKPSYAMRAIHVINLRRLSSDYPDRWAEFKQAAPSIFHEWHFTWDMSPFGPDPPRSYPRCRAEKKRMGRGKFLCRKTRVGDRIHSANGRGTESPR